MMYKNVWNLFVQIWYPIKVQHCILWLGLLSLFDYRAAIHSLPTSPTLFCHEFIKENASLMD